MADYPNRTRKELYGYCIANGLDVHSGMTKGSLESKVRHEIDTDPQPVSTGLGDFE